MDNQTDTSSAADKIITQGIHMDLTDALKAAVVNKCERLFRHQERIIRVRVYLEYDKRRTGKPHFIAKGHIEIGGPDMVVTMESEDAYKAIDMMAQKLDRLLRVRASAHKKKRLHPRTVDLAAVLPKHGAEAK
jgi:putative sigma-54 modulation protein